MDVAWQHANAFSPADLRDLAYAAFLEKWEEEGLPAELTIEQQAQFGTRTPGIARAMLHEYIKARRKILLECNVLAIEQPFAVPMPGTNTWYIGKLDKVIEFQGAKIIVEHKTTALYKKDGGFQDSYITGWYSDAQVKGYQFAGELFYPGLSQIWIDAALAHKTVHDQFRFIPVQHNFQMLQEWAEDTADWIRRVEHDIQRNRFPKNENSCMGKYGPCGMLDICRTTAQPEKLTAPPDGYIVEKWEPFDVLGLDKLIQGHKDG